jgi:hypothetical protein
MDRRAYIRQHSAVASRADRHLTTHCTARRPTTAPGPRPIPIRLCLCLCLCLCLALCRFAFTARWRRRCAGYGHGSGDGRRVRSCASNHERCSRCSPPPPDATSEWWRAELCFGYEPCNASDEPRNARSARACDQSPSDYERRRRRRRRRDRDRDRDRGRGRGYPDPHHYHQQLTCKSPVTGCSVA